MHFQAVGVGNLVIAFMNLVGGGMLLSRDIPFAWLSVGGATVSVVGVLALAAGIGLLAGRKWARIPAFLVAVAVFLIIPIGTLFGIYTWVVLRHPEERAALR